jgi:hypothetical protein
VKHTPSTPTPQMTHAPGLLAHALLLVACVRASAAGGLGTAPRYAPNNKEKADA